MNIKGKILKVGEVNYIGKGEYEIKEWSFDCKGEVPAINISNDNLLLCGYSIEELLSISSLEYELLK